jgi:hypothetical protein
MPLVRFTLLATAACLIGAAAYAQPTGDTTPPAGGGGVPQTPPVNNTAGPNTQAPPDHVTDQGAQPNSATAGQGSAETDQSGAAASGQMNAAPPNGAETGAAANTSANVGPGGSDVIASQPVPDTPANRAAYGQPMSRAGKRTAPTGD